jgi:hypothetical protein
MFTHQGQVMAQARGMVLSADGAEGMAGMYGTTCVFNAENGQMGADYDLDGDEEVVEDSSIYGIVLTRSREGIHEVAPYGGAFSSADEAPAWQTDNGLSDAFETTELAGVLAARWLDDVPVALASDFNQCSLHELGSAPRSVVLDATVCQGYQDMVVNQQTQDIYVASNAGVLRVNDAQVTEWLDVRVDSLSWDAAEEIMYVSINQGAKLQARLASGELLWERESAGLTSLTHMGPMGAVSTMEEDGAGRGMLSVFEGRSGQLMESIGTPSSGHAMNISENGATLAIAVEDYIHLFSVK